MSRPKIDVAIIGGGIGGLCLAIGLLENPSLKVHVYEAAHAFSEIGAGIVSFPRCVCFSVQETLSV